LTHGSRGLIVASRTGQRSVKSEYPPERPSPRNRVGIGLFAFTVLLEGSMPKENDLARDHRLSVRLRKHERDAITRAAREACQTAAEWVREVITRAASAPKAKN
jgi:hypothetical protein